jgi:lysozyme family protein
MDFSESGLEAAFGFAHILPDKIAEADHIATILLDNIARYRVVALESDIPWQMIGCLHALESSFSFARHLYNGDPLSARTVHVPIGKPEIGCPPFTWEESAEDAMCKVWRPTDWGLGGRLDFLERYNGIGYRKHDIRSPYVWAGTSAYQSGKYISDGTFDPSAVSDQIGAAAILKSIQLKSCH